MGSYSGDEIPYMQEKLHTIRLDKMKNNKIKNQQAQKDIPTSADYSG